MDYTVIAYLAFIGYYAYKLFISGGAVFHVINSYLPDGIIYAYWILPAILILSLVVLLGSYYKEDIRNFF
jgi:hypothetical protein